MGERLVRETYFISPVYDEHGNVIDELHKGRPADSLDEWLEQNSLSNGMLMGENGVFCEISTTDYAVPKRPQWKTHDSYPYIVLVKVGSSPASRELPPELIEILSARGYEEKSEDFELQIGTLEMIPLPDFFD